MAEIRHYINGKDFGEPRNWKDLELTIDWLEQTDSGSVNVTDLSFVLEANKYLQNRILDGLNGGVGIFEGEPYQIQVGNKSNPEFTFDGYLDFTEGSTVIGKEEIVCALKKRRGDDWLNDVADGFSFAYLHDQNIITDSDFVKIPYVVNYIPDGLEIIVLSLSIYMISKEIAENIQKIAEAVGDISNAGTPVVGVSVGVGAGVVTAWDLGDYILVALKVIARIVYIIAMIKAIKELTDTIFDNILPKKRNHIGMTFRSMFEKGCQYLDLKFESSINELNWTYIPQKSKKGDDDDNGFPTIDSEISTFGNLIRFAKRTFNADYRIENGILKLERKDSFKSSSQYKMPNFFNDQERLLDSYEFNTDEMVANYNINFAFDVQDQNTLDNNEGRVFQATTSATATKNEDLSKLKGLTEIRIPMSQGLRKNELNTVEKVLKDFGSIVDEITGIFGGGTNYKSKIERRVGSLLLSSHFTSTGKIVKMSGNSLSKDQREIVSASNLWEKYHYINSFAKYKGSHNQYLRYKEQPVPMSIQDFALLLNDNKAIDDNGNEYEIEKVTYNPYKTTALIDFRIKRIYTDNLNIKIVK